MINSSRVSIMSKSIGTQMYDLMKKLFPINRSLTGNGVRKTLSEIKKYIPLNVHEIKSGTKVFDWVVPEEWNVIGATLKSSNGEIIADVETNNLHLVGYSMPINRKMDLEELKEHLYFNEEMPDAIPYVTSYYHKSWGFCIPYNTFKNLKEGQYEVDINSSLDANGSLSYADFIIKGKTEEEIIISTYTCHPSMANNELSGPIVSTFLAMHYLKNVEVPYYTLRFVFGPERMGTMVYLSKHLKHLKKNVVAGVVLTCIGDSGKFSYIQTRREGTLIDKAALHILNNIDKEKSFTLYDFTKRASDEIQYNYPGIDIPVGVLTRTKFGEYPEYHTSTDNMKLITPENLEKSLQLLIRLLDCINKNRKYTVKFSPEPMLSKRNLFPKISNLSSSKESRSVYRIPKLISDFLIYCDGTFDVIDIAEKLKIPVWELYEIIDICQKNDLIVLPEYK